MGGHSDFVVVVVFFISLALYFLPAVIASSKRHPRSVAIFILNLLAGWTLVGWIASLVWAFVAPIESVSPAPGKNTDKISGLEKLASLKERGLLTEAEFESEKSKLLQG